jgi:segregation and condensation protein B
VEEQQLRAILESLLFAAGEPVSLSRLGNALESVPRETLRQALTEMTAAYRNDGRGLVLEEVAGGYQLRTPSEYSPYIRRLLSAKPPRLSRPLLETLAIIAYRRQATRPEIEQLRGVDTGGVLETLLERNLIRMAGRKDAPGRPIFYETSPGFLELFGLRSLEELPDLEEFRAIDGTLAQALTEPPKASAMEPGKTGDSEAISGSESVMGDINATGDSVGVDRAQFAGDPATPTDPATADQSSNRKSTSDDSQS